ncbi:hypothetical protein CYG49_03155 [Candidatus Saccharibacteria bacterium]|nr:MAG: hypothetical protein CYG49_03155 [Candidatus Saccharibacteria bacterium]
MAGDLLTETFTEANKVGWPLRRWARILQRNADHRVEANTGILQVGDFADASVRVSAVTRPCVDQSLVFKYKKSTTSGSVTRLRAWVRGNGTFNADVGGSGYTVAIYGNSSTIELRRSEGTTTSTLLATASYSNTTAYHWCRLEAVGTTVQVRFWADGTAEPSTWLISVTDTMWASGIPMFNAYHGGSTAPYVGTTFTVDDITYTDLGNSEPLNDAGSATQVTESGSLRSLISAQTVGFAAENSEGYIVPSTQQQNAFTSAWQQVIAGDMAAAAAAISSYPYDVVTYTDTDSGRMLRLLRERKNPSGKFVYGWGTYVFDPNASSKLIIEAPHAVADSNTELEAADLMTKERARALIVCGAHRNANAQLVDGDRAADVANFAGSVFQAVHEVFLSDTSLVFLQPHGFADATEPNYNIIISQGESTSTQLVKDCASGLLHLGFLVQVYDGTGVLGATGNTQGKATRAVGAQFIHLEQNFTLRSNSAAVTTVVQYMAGFNPWFARTKSISSDMPL